MPDAKEVGREITANYLRKISMFSYRSGSGGKHMHPLIAVFFLTQVELKRTTDENRLRGPLGSQESENNFVGQWFPSTGPWTINIYQTRMRKWTIFE